MIIQKHLEFYSNIVHNVLTVNSNCAILDFNADNTITDSFKIKEKVTGKTGNNSRTDVEIIVPLKYISNFCRAHEMS